MNTKKKNYNRHLFIIIIEHVDIYRIPFVDTRGRQAGQDHRRIVGDVVIIWAHIVRALLQTIRKISQKRMGGFELADRVLKIRYRAGSQHHDFAVYRENVLIFIIMLYK